MGKEYEEIKSEISVRISTEDIDDIVTTALEGGICYWCKRAEVKGKYLGEFASEQISRGGTLVLHDSVDGKKRELNKEKLLNGVKQYLEDENKPYNILVDAEDSVGCSKHSLPAMWKRKGFIDKEPETWWGVQTYVTDRQGRCSGKYNPTTKDGKLNFEWLLEATEENQQKIIDEIYRRANAIWYREDWYLEDLEEAIRSSGLEVTQERVDKLLEECHRIFDDKSGRNEMLAQKVSELFKEE